MRRFKNTLAGLVLFAMCLPLLQQATDMVQIRPLSGAYNLPPTEPLNIPNWFEGSFQDKYTPAYEYSIGFRPFFVRLRNQLNYWIFGTSTNYVVIGKENQLYAWNYWFPFSGGEFLGEDTIAARAEGLAALKEQLKKRNKELLVVIAPNKVRYMPEYMPDHYPREEALPNNYQAWREQLQLREISFIDFNHIFLSLKDEYGKRLFPNTGTHWSAYGMAMALDSILAVADKAQGGSLAGLDLKQAVLADSIVPSDNDLNNDLNLFFPIENERNLFPRIDSGEDGRKAKLFVIGDSFFWNLYQLDAFYSTVDSSTHFWYYNNSRYRVDGSKTALAQYNPVEVAARADLVVLLATEANLHLFPYGFPEDFLEASR